MRIALRWVLASIAYFVLLALPAWLLPLAPTPGVSLPAEVHAAWEAPLYWALMLPAFVYLVHRPRVRGRAQLAAVALFVWGTQTFMTQLETDYFRSAFPAISTQEMIRLFLRNLLTLAAFLPLALWLADRFRGEQEITRPTAPLVDARALVWKLPVLGLAYVAIYFVFGYFVAFQLESVRALYTGSTELPSFTAQLAAAVAEHPTIVPFQIARGALWGALALVLLAILGRTRREGAIACAGLFAVLPTAQLVFANPFMPAAVRYAHFVEVGVSMALFGALAAWLLARGGERGSEHRPSTASATLARL